MGLHKQIEEAKDRALKLKDDILTKTSDPTDWEVSKTKALIELEKVRSNLLIAQALNKLAVHN